MCLVDFERIQNYFLTAACGSDTDDDMHRMHPLLFVCLPRQQCHPCGFFSSCNSRDIQSAWCVREDWISPFKRWYLVRNGNVLICSTQRCGLMQIRKRHILEGGARSTFLLSISHRFLKLLTPCRGNAAR